MEDSCEFCEIFKNTFFINTYSLFLHSLMDILESYEIHSKNIFEWGVQRICSAPHTLEFSQSLERPLN